MTNPMVYWAPPAFALRLSQRRNDRVRGDAHADIPKRFRGASIKLPLQDTKLRARDLDRAARLPRHSERSTWGPHVNGRQSARQGVLARDLCALRGARAAALSCTISTQVLAERLKDLSHVNVLGNPYEERLCRGHRSSPAACSTAFPKLEVYLPHGGGTFPWLIGVFDYAAAHNPALKHYEGRPPSAVISQRFLLLRDRLPTRRSWRDLIEPGLVEPVRVVMGTDFPQQWPSGSRSGFERR
jgi:hypothetical protein